MGRGATFQAGQGPGETTTSPLIEKAAVLEGLVANRELHGRDLMPWKNNCQVFLEDLPLPGLRSEQDESIVPGRDGGSG